MGLNFCLPSFKFPKKDFLLYFEYFLHKLQGQPLLGNQSSNFVVNKCKIVLDKLPKLFRYSFNLVTKEDIGILKKLKENDSIVISKPDKGNGTVLMNKDDYLEKMNVIIGDRSKFKKIEHYEIFKVNLNYGR